MSAAGDLICRSFHRSLADAAGATEVAGAPGAPASPGAPAAPGALAAPGVPASPGAAGAASAGTGHACVAVDLAAEPAAAAELERLGLRLPDDLPAMVLASRDGRLKVLGVRLSAAELDRLAAGQGWAPAATRVYATTWCPDCRRTKRLLSEAGVEFAEIDIESDHGAGDLVVARSGGRSVVPTLELDGRLWAFNPEPALLRRLIGP